MGKLEKLISVTRAILAWEGFWRAFSAALAIICLFLAVSWFGLWIATPPVWRALGVGLFALLTLAVFAWEMRGFRVSSADAVARIDETSGDPNALASALLDRPANAADPVTAALWRVHRARLEKRLERIKIALPSPRAVDRDRYALRAAAFLLAAVAFIVAGAERPQRLMTAFSWKYFDVGATGARIDAWIDPPAYTGKPPIVLTMMASGDARQPIAAPIGSQVIVRGAKTADAAIVVSGALAPVTIKAEPQAQGNEQTQGQGAGQADAQAKASARVAGAAVDTGVRYTLKGDGRLSVGGRTFDLVAIPDKVPIIELLEQPRANYRGSLTTVYRVEDDYGVTSAEALFSDPEIDGRAIRGKILAAAPKAFLILPAGDNGEAKTTSDLADSPWGGVRAILTLRARDDAGNLGSSAPIAIYVPQRSFTRPLARALVEQRRNLVFEPDRPERVLFALQALMMASQTSGISVSAYLGLRTAAVRLGRARSDAALVDVADYLWSIALQLEDGDVSEAERDLRAAQQELREALQRNAPPEEIARLTRNLRAAMDKFLSALAEQQARDQRKGEGAPDSASRLLTKQDFKNMIDRMEEAAKAGDQADAQKTLDQLQALLENLKSGRPSQQGGQSPEMKKALGDLDKLMRDQNQLRDDTFHDSHKQPGDRSSGEKNAQGKSAQGKSAEGKPDGDQNGHSLQQRQQALGQRLTELQQSLQDMLGSKPGANDKGREGAGQQGQKGGQEGQEGQGGKTGQNGKTGKNSEGEGNGLGEALDAMGKAEGALGRRGDPDRAIEEQGRALESLRRGARDLAQKMRGQGKQSSGQPGSGEGEGEGEGEPDSSDGRQADGERDPLGRRSARDPNNVRSRNAPLDATPALRAQRVLEELRRRLSDPARPREERDYLERLIRRY